MISTSTTISSIKSFSEVFDNYNTQARLVSVYDADTITVTFPFPNTSDFYKYNVRLLGIDTPEMKSKDATLRDKADQARIVLLKYLNPNEQETSKYYSKKKKEHQEYLNNNVINLRLECKSLDKYGRILANIFTLDNDTTSISKYLAEQNVGYEYSGGTKLSDEQQNKYFE